MEIKFLKEEDFSLVAELSKIFAEEGCCNNIIADSQEYYVGKKVLGCYNDGELVGYCYGEMLTEEKERSYAQVDDLYFELEEIYVLPEYRSQGAGRRLFGFIEGYVRACGCKTIRLNAVSKDYKKLLNFYIDIIGMEIISAYLIKRI